MTTDDNRDQGDMQPQPVQTGPSQNPSAKPERGSSGQGHTLFGLTPSRRPGEVVRLLMVLLLFAAFILTLVWSFLSASGPHWNNVKGLLDLIFPAETALLGTAIAFYMTDSRGDDRKD
jgi:hypothetical protein